LDEKGEIRVDEMNKICPHVKESCIGANCSEFVPRYKYRGYYNNGIQDVLYFIYCKLIGREYKEPSYVGTICAHCKLEIRSARIWDKDEYMNKTLYDERTGML
jgi:hypothetical protein